MTHERERSEATHDPSPTPRRPGGSHAPTFSLAERRNVFEHMVAHELERRPPRARRLRELQHFGESLGIPRADAQRLIRDAERRAAQRVAEAACDVDDETMPWAPPSVAAMSPTLLVLAVTVALLGLLLLTWLRQ